MFLTFIVVSFLSHAALTSFARGETRAFLSVLLFTHFYFCIAGYSYWVYVNDGYFVGAWWDLELLARSALVLSVATTALAATVFLFDGRAPLNRMPAESDTPPVHRLVWTLVGAGFVASLFVLARGSFSEAGAERGSLFLIAYQFSDLLIPALLYLIAKRGYSRFNVVLVIYFLIFAMLVGFRYKIALVVIALFVEIMLRPVPVKRKIAVMTPTAAAVLALFTFMTLYRTKFGVPDLTREIRDPLNELAFGLFAEANILFGLTAVMTMFVDREIMVYFQPIIDALLEFIPRFIWPNRNTGEYFWNIYIYGLYTEQGASSGTAHPFVGEFGAMFGWFGIVFGPIVYGLLYVVLHRRIMLDAQSWKVRQIGVGLLVGMFAYYHYTRGYTPQATKAYVFIIAPYLGLCFLEARAARRRVAQPTPSHLSRSAKRMSTA